MNDKLSLKTTNTILYCAHWRQTVAFYQEIFQFPVSFSNEWFVEFQVTERAYLSVADETRASINSSQGAGITLALQVDDIEAVWQHLQSKGAVPGSIKQHAWGARVFYCFDPEGHRIEVWMDNKVPDVQQET